MLTNKLPVVSIQTSEQLMVLAGAGGGAGNVNDKRAPGVSNANTCGRGGELTDRANGLGCLERRNTTLSAGRLGLDTHVARFVLPLACDAEYGARIGFWILMTQPGARAVHIRRADARTQEHGVFFTG